MGGLGGVCVCVCDAVTKNSFDEAWTRLGKWEELGEGRVRRQPSASPSSNIFGGTGVH